MRTQGKLRLLWFSLISSLLTISCQAEDPSPKPWPEQFHSQIYANATGSLSLIDLWYDWPSGRNFNIIQNQLSFKLYDLEWNNGTSYYYNLEAKTCTTVTFPVGILRPDWLDHSQYIGVQEIDGFTCNVWEKADFITYYEDLATQRPVAWYFKTSGRSLHVITFNDGATLPDESWQSPSYCFTGSEETQTPSPVLLHGYGLHNPSCCDPWERWVSGISTQNDLESNSQYT